MRIRLGLALLLMPVFATQSIYAQTNGDKRFSIYISAGEYLPSYAFNAESGLKLGESRFYFRLGGYVSTDEYGGVMGLGWMAPLRSNISIRPYFTLAMAPYRKDLGGTNPDWLVNVGFGAGIRIQPEYKNWFVYATINPFARFDPPEGDIFRNLRPVYDVKGGLGAGIRF